MPGKHQPAQNDIMKKQFVRLIAILIILINCLFATGQDPSSTKADSIYDHFRSQDIENYQSAFPLLLEAFQYYKSMKDSCKISGISLRISECYEALGSIDSALQILLWSEAHSQKCNLKAYAKNISSQSGIYLSLEEYEKVIRLVDDVEENWPEYAPDSLIEDLPVNKAIALVYTDRTDEAKIIFKNILKQKELKGNVQDQIDALGNLGALYGMSEDYDSAAYFLQIANRLCAEINCDDQNILLQNLATLAANQEKFELSVFYLDSAIAMARISENLSSETELLREISIATTNLGDFEKAWDFLMAHSDLKDTLFSTERARSVAEFQEKYESEKQTRKIKELELDSLDADLREHHLRQTRNIILTIGIGFLIFAFALWSRLRYISRTKTIIESEKERSESLLLNILPAEVAEELKVNGKADARDFDMVSILFTDFLQFTEISGELTASELVAEINVCFEAFDRITDRFKIEKIKTIGDAYMAAGGLPVPTSDSALNTVLAALEMQDFIVKRKAENDADGKPAFEMRVGIHTGPVVAGIVGVKKFQYDIWGDTVNTASRIESNGETGKVNISQATYELLKEHPDFAFKCRGKIEAKGKGEIEMWFVEKAITTINS